MKLNIFKKVLLILYLLSFQFFAQNTCPISGLADDLADDDVGQVLKLFIDDNNGLESWIFMFDAFERTRVFTKDVPTLNKLKTLIDDLPFRNRLDGNWVDELSIILEKNKILHCDAAGTASGLGRYYSKMDVFLEEVEYFVKNFDVSQAGAKKFYSWMKRSKLDGTPISNEGLGILAEMYQTLEVLKRKGLNSSNVASLGANFTNGINGVFKQFDILTSSGKYIELKNVNFISNKLKNSTQTVNQLIDGYFRNISNFDNFEWIVNFKKLKAHGWADEATALTNMKTQFKEMFQDGNNAQNAFDAIWSNASLRNDLFDSSLTKVEMKNDFLDMIETMDNNLFKFIKVE
ncbi:hypothetical protein [Polaribacter sp. L3A8]|uniref:hypothetical protein n=1 Tax=Polaribacter sp. L3A8 TaxID=2686361 RepID=UPI00131C5265|nr:hypothetical protein [Polaribacter sp. L3A8]